MKPQCCLQPGIASWNNIIIPGYTAIIILCGMATFHSYITHINSTADNSTQISRIMGSRSIQHFCNYYLSPFRPNNTVIFILAFNSCSGGKRYQLIIEMQYPFLQTDTIIYK